MIEREFDIIVFGATGYTGRLVVEYLLKTHGAGDKVRWAMAGRSHDRLFEVSRLLNASNPIPLIVADAHDRGALDAMVRRTKVIISTAGPFTLYGSDLVAAAVSAGTDYIDIAGEANWLVEMMEIHAKEAKATGSRVVSSCGFDSIPSDAGVWFLQREAMRAWGCAAKRVRGRLRGASGGMSGGSIASGAALMALAAQDQNIWKLLSDPFALTPGFKGPVQPDASTAYEDHLVSSWVAEFMLAPTNTKVVHRTNLLLGHPWGKGFLYDEMQMIDGPPAGGEPVFDEAMLAMKPGDGPTREQRESGFYDLLFVGESLDGRVVRASVRGDMDPGYGSTAKMLSEAAMTLAFDVRPEDVGGGFWTPVTAMGRPLIDRLTNNAGVSFTIES